MTIISLYLQDHQCHPIWMIDLTTSVVECPESLKQTKIFVLLLLFCILLFSESDCYRMAMSDNRWRSISGAYWSHVLVRVWINYFSSGTMIFLVLSRHLVADIPVNRYKISIQYYNKKTSSEFRNPYSAIGCILSYSHVISPWQVIGMLMHRTETFLHLISNTPIQCSCRGSSCFCGKEKKNKRVTLTEKNIDNLMEYMWTIIKMEQLGLGILLFYSYSFESKKYFNCIE